MEIKIRDEFIKLGQALKLAGVVEDGVEAKYAIQDGLYFLYVISLSHKYTQIQEYWFYPAHYLHKKYWFLYKIQLQGKTNILESVYICGNEIT